MPLPIGYMYQKKALGAGTVGTVQHYNIEHVPAGTDVNYGVAIKIQDQAGVVADKAPIFGITTKRGYAMGDDYSAIEDDHWYKGEDMGVLTEGAISVPITADVNRLDLAAINADGTFKPAGAGDTAVGHFLTAGDKDSTAIVYVNLTSVNTTATATPDVSGAGK